MHKQETMLHEWYTNVYLIRAALLNAFQTNCSCLGVKQLTLAKLRNQLLRRQLLVVCLENTWTMPTILRN